MNTEAIQPATENYTDIKGVVKAGDTLFDIFKKYAIDTRQLRHVKETSAGIHRLRNLRPGNPYVLRMNDNKELMALTYHIDEDNILNVTRNGSEYTAAKTTLEYEKRLEHVSGIIRDNLISSMGNDRENVNLALQISDILSWDIDFTTDLRPGDTFKVIVEGLYRDDEFKKYGNVVALEFFNDGALHRAYRFEINGKADYFDARGKSFRKAFLKAPLNYRRISSHFSHRRHHPIRKIYRPHHGIDYAAPTGTPVSAIGDGTVVFAGYRGDYGNLVIIRHGNNSQSYYGHLSRIGSSVKTGRKVNQGDFIGRVGSTGLATGPHLHFEMRIQDRPVNPLAMKTPPGKSVPSSMLAEFQNATRTVDTRLASIPLPSFAHAEKSGEQRSSF
jgi:murein DD-endopeptidase MepM/ murein hydrolase activator NlpD